jgi:hypothetical protein
MFTWKKKNDSFKKIHFVDICKIISTLIDFYSSKLNVNKLIIRHLLSVIFLVITKQCPGFPEKNWPLRKQLVLKIEKKNWDPIFFTKPKTPQTINKALRMTSNNKSKAHLLWIHRTWLCLSWITHNFYRGSLRDL